MKTKIFLVLCFIFTLSANLFARGAPPITTSKSGEKEEITLQAQKLQITPILIGQIIEQTIGICEKGELFLNNGGGISGIISRHSDFNDKPTVAGAGNINSGNDESEKVCSTLGGAYEKRTKSICFSKLENTQGNYISATSS